ncbi:MAG TPA: hypothetical protein VGX92_04965 [Pyrinomonadaceae bacterium]|jgi:hypothetical protein|nr:hypothetical protein [Pyrinomonadaceae bacterium]
MHTSRITNASLFVTVLSACLSLLMTGTPAQAHAQQQQDRATAANKSQALAATDGPCGPQSPEQARKIAAASNSYFRIAICHATREPAPLLYQNDRALIDRNRVLVVTRLPRASLLLSPFAKQAANDSEQDRR